MQEDVRGATDRSGAKSNTSQRKDKKKGSILGSRSEKRYGDEEQHSLDPISLDPPS